MIHIQQHFVQWQDIYIEPLNIQSIQKFLCPLGKSNLIMSFQVKLKYLKKKASPLDFNGKACLDILWQIFCKVENVCFLSKNVAFHGILSFVLDIFFLNDNCWEVYFLLKISNFIDWIRADTSQQKSFRKIQHRLYSFSYGTSHI